MHHLLLWAKSEPFHPLWCHLLDVAAVCEGLVPRFGGVQPLPVAWVALLTALHDIGKADPWFQNKDDDLAAGLRVQGLDLPLHTGLEDERRKFRHEARSAEWILDWLVAKQSWGKRAARVASDAVRGHHGDFSVECYKEESAELLALWNSLREALCELVWDVLRPPHCAPQRLNDASAVGAKLSGLIVLADWIASNDELYPYPKLDRTSTPPAYYSEARRQAEIVLRRLEFDAPTTITAAGTPAFQEVWPKLKARPLQAKLEELCRAGLPQGLSIIEAPMGEGKTEAAIYLAECWNGQAGRRGSYLALPTQASANQVHDRFEKFLKDRRPGFAGPRLVHGMAWLIDNATPAAMPQTFGGEDSRKTELLAREWFRPARRALLAGEGVGTVDQALLAALHVKFGFLRLLGLSAKTLIIDEVHAYDDYMTTIMERLLEWCHALKISVILLSATLSREQKMKLCGAYSHGGREAVMQALFDTEMSTQAPYPLLTFVPLEGAPRAEPTDADPERSRRVGLQLHYGLLDDVTGTAQLAASMIVGGGCACVLANTVRSAQEIFRALEALRTSGKLHDTKLLLFHARFRAEERNRIEKQVTDLFGKDADPKRPRRAILVATQVVEQSLDVDFDVMISQLAPVDLLLQRSGRLWRHHRDWRGKMTQPVLHVLLSPVGSLKFGATEKVYSRVTILRTLALLQGRAAFDLPADFRPLIEGCYGSGPLPNDLIPFEELAKAAMNREDERAEHASLAQRHLLPEPRPDVFEMARKSNEEAEGEGGSQSYFVAQTRLGDQTLAALVLHERALIELAKSDYEEAMKPRRERKVPPREQLKRLFLQKVNVPAWWLSNAQPWDGYEPFFEGHAWLRGQIVVPMRDGGWRARDSKGREFLIRDDPKLGLQRLAINSERETDEEADAGQVS